MPRPLLDGRLGPGRAALDTDRGRIASAWGFDADGAGWNEIEVAAGCDASVTLPGPPLG